MYYISGLETTSVNDGDLYSVALRFQQGLSDPVKIGTREGDFDLSLGRVRT